MTHDKTQREMLCEEVLTRASTTGTFPKLNLVNHIVYGNKQRRGISPPTLELITWLF